MRRTFLVAIVPPGLGEALQEAIEIRIAMRQNVDRFARGQAGEVMLYGSDLVEPSKWVERGQNGAEPVLHRLVDAV